MNQSQGKTQQAYEWIRDRIRDGAFTPGYRLVLGQIADELGFSVVPVREAIRQLEAEQLVTFERNVGARVAMVDEAEYTHVMQTLALVEGYATALSARNLTSNDIAEARSTNDEMLRCLSNFEPHRFTELNQLFHTTLFSRCPNGHLCDIANREWDRLRSLRDSTFSFVPGRAHESVKEHEEIMVLIEREADLLDVELAVREHRLGTLDAFLEYRSSRNRD